MKINGIDISKTIDESNKYITESPLEVSKGTKAMKKTGCIKKWIYYFWNKKIYAV